MTIQPLPQTSPVIQIPSSIDYTSRDYMGFVQSLLVYASQAFPQWNIQSEGDFGVMLLELMSYIGDINSFYTDRVQLEAYLPTATQRQSLLNIAQLLGYVPSNGTPATGTVTFVTDNPGLAVTIAEGTVLQANFNTTLDSAIQFYTTAVATCPGNGGTVTVPVSQGSQFSMIPIGTSNGNPGQELSIPQPHVLDGSVSIFVQSTAPGGTTQWSQVSSFINADNTDTVYTLTTNADFTTTVTFGDGINGLVPALGVQIYASYTIILGSAGNQSAGAVNILVTPLTGISVQNIGGIFQSSIMTGGSDPESNESIRTNAPISFATQTRAVSLSDFANLALNIPGVTVANAVANHSTSVSLYLLGPNVTVPTAQLQSQVLTYFQNATLAGVSLSLPTPNLVPVDVGSNANNITLQVKPAFSQQATVNAVVLALNSLLTPPSTQFGQLLNLSDIITAITSVDGVQFTIVPVFTREDVIQTGTAAIQFRSSEIPIAGNYYITAQGGI